MATTKSSGNRPILGSSHSGGNKKIGTVKKKKGPAKGSSGPVGEKKKKTLSKDGISLKKPVKKLVKKKPKSESGPIITGAEFDEVKPEKPEVSDAKGEDSPPSKRKKTAAVAGEKAPPVNAKEKARLDEARKLALTLANAGLEKKAIDVQIIDVVGKVAYADYLVLMSGRSDRHVQALSDSLEEFAVNMAPKRKPLSVEGRNVGQWIVLDFADVVAHVFQEENRLNYDLDSRWTDARRIPLPLPPPPSGRDSRVAG